MNFGTLIFPKSAYIEYYEFFGYNFWMFKKENFETLNSLKAIQKMKWQDFEWFCKYFLEALGFQRVQVTKRRYDGGIDHIAYLNGDKYLVQDKHWNKNGSKKKRYVPVAIVRELGGVMKQKDCDKGIIIATVPAYETTKIEAKKLGITIITDFHIKHPPLKNQEVDAPSKIIFLS